LADIIRSQLIYIVVQPVGVQQVGMTTPTHKRGLRRVVARKIVGGDMNGQTLTDVAVVFTFQGKRIVFRMTGNESVPPIFRSDNVDASLVRFSQDEQVTDALDKTPMSPAVTGFRAWPFRTADGRWTLVATSPASVQFE
jgi:hypothetical protein